MLLDTPTIIKWGARFPLREAEQKGEANPVPAGVRGIYLWGFDAFEKEIIWYIGKGVLRSRLCAHIKWLETAHNQIPKGFLNGNFKSLADVASGWKRDPKDPRVLECLRDKECMSNKIKAGHAFASQAFARIAPVSDKAEKELYEVESAVIYELQPFINQRNKKTSNYFKVFHEPSPVEHSWLQDWDATRKLLPGLARLGGKEPLSSLPSPSPLLLGAAQLDELRRRLISLLNKIDLSPRQDEKGKLARRIGRLTGEGKIPRDVSACMMTITEARNLVVFEEKTLSPTHSAAVNAVWEAVKEWATAEGIKISE
jgi:hypothetical protein